MSLILIGLNHRTAPVEVRERLAFSREGAAAALMLFRRQHAGAEAIILSTCNRVEILVHSEDGSVGAPQVARFLSQARNVALDEFESHLIALRDQEVIRHLFRVISGLDSMVFGECQIVNQLKQAYQLAHEQQTAGPVLHRLMHHAFGVSKRVRSDTGIADGKTSIPSVAVEMIRNAVPDFASRRILMVGAGEMAQLTSQYLHKFEASNLVVTTRTLSNGKTLAEACRGTAVPYSELDQQLALADIVVTATACPTAILTVDRIGRCLAQRDGRPMLLVDLAVPRNIEHEVSQLEGVTLYDVDTLGRIAAENERQRLSQLEACERIIDEEVGAFEKWAAESKVRPLIERMYQDVRALAEIEVRSLLRRCPDLNERQRDAVNQLVDRLVGKLMHPCVSAARQGSATTLADAFRATRISFSPDRPQAQEAAADADEALCTA